MTGKSWFDMTPAEREQQREMLRWEHRVFLLLGFLVIVALVGTLIGRSNRAQAACAAQGGVLLRDGCLDSTAVIRLEPGR